jgi:signal transduction histidine kinase
LSSLDPAYTQWWLPALALASLVGLIWLVYRNRLRHLLEVERIRTRIAADLHDDIGASLSRISILSEVVKSRLPEGEAETAAFLTEIADSSRELVDSMSEIVWSIDPRRDNLKHLLARVGQFAQGVLEAKGIRWSMRIPPDPARIKLTPEQRRSMYLILKEAINNAMKHSGCHSVHLHVEARGGLLVAQIQDDGSGLPLSSPSLETSTARRGRGLINMHARAKAVRGRVEITSSTEGTIVRLEIPYRALRGA